MIITDNSGNEGKGTNILATLYPETSYAKASELVSSAILAHPYLKGVYATHLAAATGAAAEILQAGRQRLLSPSEREGPKFPALKNYLNASSFCFSPAGSRLTWCPEGVRYNL